ncbi:MAG: hypothetical protein ACQJCO_01235 [cyanobacterium endosymbiont of Rhopalodia sterrenbergii]
MGSDHCQHWLQLQDCKASAQNIYRVNHNAEIPNDSLINGHTHIRTAFNS